MGSPAKISRRASMVVPKLLLLVAIGHCVEAGSWPSDQQQDYKLVEVQNVTTETYMQQTRLARQLHKPPNDTDGFYLNSSATLADFMSHTYTRGENIRIFTLNLQSYRPEARYVGDPVFVDSENPAHKARCQRDLEFYRQALDSVRDSDPDSSTKPLDYWRLADSFGRPEAGSLRGSQFWLGAYEQCLGIRMERDNGTEAVESQYCLGLTKFPNWSRNDTKIFVRVGLCLPVTCTSSMFNDDAKMLEKVERMMKDQFVSAGPYAALELDQVYCLPHETSPIRQYSLASYGFYLVLATFIILNLVFTVIDCRQTKSVKNSARMGEQKGDWFKTLVESFSLVRNWNKFLQIREEPKREVAGKKRLNADDNSNSWWAYDRGLFLNTLNGIKCIGLYLIVAGHVMYIVMIPGENIIDTDALLRSFAVSVYVIGNFMVDSFFTLSAIIATFFIFKAGVDKMNARQWITLIAHRYWRLTPIYLLVFWFSRSVSMLIQSGPLWDFGTAEQSSKLNCSRLSWWFVFLHQADLVSPTEGCIPVAYYIADEMKFFLVAPIFQILISKSIRRGYLITIGAILANIAYVAMVSMRASEHVKMGIFAVNPEAVNYIFKDLQEVYMRSHCRIGAYLVGILAGHLLYLADRGKLQMKLPKPAVVVIWTLVTANMLSIMIFPKVFDSIKVNADYLTPVFGLLLSTTRPVWAICTSWLIFALAHGQAKWLSAFLGAKIWQIVAKLCFSILMVHGETLVHCYWHTSQTYPLTKLVTIAQPIAVMAICIAIGLMLMLMVENPLAGIDQLILPRQPTKFKPSETNQASKAKTSDETSSSQ